MRNKCFFVNYGGPGNAYFADNYDKFEHLDAACRNEYSMPKKSVSWFMHGLKLEVFMYGVHRALYVELPNQASSETKERYALMSATARDFMETSTYNIASRNCVTSVATTLHALDATITPSNLVLPWSLDSIIKKCQYMQTNEASLRPFFDIYHKKTSTVSHFAFPRVTSSPMTIAHTEDITQHAYSADASEKTRTRSTLLELQWVTEDHQGILHPTATAPIELHKSFLAYNHFLKKLTLLKRHFSDMTGNKLRFVEQLFLPAVDYPSALEIIEHFKPKLSDEDKARLQLQIKNWEIEENIASLQLSPLTSLSVDEKKPSDKKIYQLNKELKALSDEHQQYLILHQNIKNTHRKNHPDLIALEEKIDAMDSKYSAQLTLTHQVQLEVFTQEINQDIHLINNLINAYNEEHTLEGKTHIITNIKAIISGIEDKYPDRIFAQSSEYRQKFHHGLLSNIRKNERLSNQILLESGLPPPPASYQFQFSDVISTMSTDKQDLLLALLSKGSPYNESLRGLYNINEEEYTPFNLFLDTVNITGMNGYNSKNYKVTPLDTTKSPYVLKIENRLNQPKDIAKSLHLKLSNIFLEKDIAQTAAYTATDIRGNPKTMVRTLIVQDYCESGSLFSTALETISPSEKLSNALIIYQDMAQILLDIQKQGCVFCDMKNSNWLINNDHLCIGDDKSFRLLNENGDIDIFSQDSQWFGDMIKTPSSMPPEVFKDIPISGESLHVYTFGKNLYEYLIASSESKYDKSYLQAIDGRRFNYEDFMIFRIDPEGKALKKLIEDCVRPEPADRISMKEALASLQKIQLEKTIKTTISNLIPFHLYPWHIMEQYLQTLSSLDLDQLQAFQKILTFEQVNAELKTLETKINSNYERNFKKMMQDLSLLVQQYPHKAVQSAYETLYEQYKTLKPNDYAYFEADLKSLLSDANSVKCTTIRTELQKTKQDPSSDKQSRPGDF